MKSKDIKEKHYRYEEAYGDGIKEGNSPDPCCLLPEKFWAVDELGDAWLKGFNEALARKKK